MIYKGVELYNVQELLDVPGEEGKLCSRIPDTLRLRLNEFAQFRALETAGCEARFILQGERARLTLRSTERPSIIEVYQGCFLVGWHVVGTDRTEIVIERPANLDELVRITETYSLPFDARLTRVVLPWRPAALLFDIEGDVELPRAEQTPSVRYLAYGSSITHGNAAVRPTATYAMRTAQLLGVDLINLGFGGGAHLEREMADYIAARQDWDMATLELGINIIGSVDVSEFARRVGYFIATVAGSHPDQWVFAIDLFTCHYDLEADPKIVAFRGIVRRTVERLGLPRLVYLSGLDLLPSVCGLTTDLVHPSPHGMEEMAHNLSRGIREHLRHGR